MKLESGFTGTISVLDAEKMQAKVTFETSTDPVTTGFLFIMNWNGFYEIPAVGDQVLVFMDASFNTGVIIGAVANDYPFSDADILGLKFPGVEIQISKSTGDTKIKLSGKASIELDELSVKGDLKVTGDADLTGDLKITGDASVTGKIDAVGIIKSTTDVQALTTKLITHVHVSATPGSPTTPPTPGT